MTDDLKNLRVDRSAFSFGTFDDENDERAYWHRQTPIKRLEGLEFMRQVAFDYDPTTDRLQRFFEITEPVRR